MPKTKSMKAGPPRAPAQVREKIKNFPPPSTTEFSPLTKSQRKRRQNRASKKVISLAGLSKLSIAYAASLVHPYEIGSAVCVPDYPSLPSRKMHVYSRGFVSTGTLGFGFIVFNPPRGVANDIDSIFYSDSTYAGAVTSSTAGAGVLAARCISDYTDASLAGTGTFARYRLVSAGIRVRYAGTELNRGGVAVGLQHPMHGTLVGLNFQQFDTHPLSERFRPGQSWATINFCPTLVGELDYSGSPPSTRGQYFLAWALQAPAAGTAAVFEYEVAANYEINGQDIRGMTASFADPTGMAVLSSTMSTEGMKPYSGSPDAQLSKTVNTANSVGNHSISHFLEGVTNTVKAASTTAEALLAFGSVFV